MLDALRRSAGGFVAKIFIALLVVSFGVWGIADIFRGFRGDTIAEVGDAQVTIQEFQNAYTREVQNFSQRIGEPLSRTQAATMGIPGQVMGQLIAEAAFDHVAKTMKVGVSPGALVKQIQENPAFKGPDGNFDRNRLARVLYANQLSEDQYIAESRKLARRRQVAEALTGEMQPPDVLLEAAHQFRTQERTIRYVTIDGSAVDAVSQPSEDALKAYFDENKSSYAAPEYRKLALLPVEPSTIADPTKIADDDARSVYDANPDRFGQSERRHVLQISYTDAAKAKADAARLKEGTSFDAIVADKGLTMKDVDLGLVTRDKLIDPAVAKDAFSMDEGTVSGVIDAQFGPRIVKVVKIEPASTKPFDEVKGDIKKKLAARKAENEVLAMHDEIEDARAGGATLTEIADRFALKVITIEAIARDGTNPKNEQVTLPDAKNLLKEAFDSDTGDEPAPVQLGRRGFLWFDVQEVIPERDRTLEEVRDRVVADWKSAQVDKKLDAKAQEIATKIEGGADFATVAAAEGLALKTSDPLTRDRKEAAIPPAAVTEAFAGPLDHVGTAEGNGQSRIVLQVSNISTPAFFAESGDIKQLAGELSNMLQTSLISQFVTGVQNQIGIKVNQTALANAVGASPQT